MAITPYSTPLQYQYKPLNLMAFAEPLMKMQEKYDLTKASLEDADVKATALQYATDPERAKQLEQLYRTKRDELVTNLLETKNYTQAASKLKQLNKLWLEDPERVALETNYKTFVERDKEEAARVAKGDIEKEEYDQWRRGELRKFEEAGGTAYTENAANPTGTYNPITGKVGRRINLQKDFDAEKKDIASKIKAKEWTGALRSLGIEPTSGDAQFVKSSFEKLSAEEIEQKVEEYMMGLERYRPWLQEKAGYNFDDYLYAKDGGEAFQKLSNGLVDKNLEANERYIKKLEADKKTDTDEYKRALENRDILLDQRNNPDANVIRGLYTRDYMNRQYDAAALGEVFEINNVKSEYTFRDIPAATGSGSDFTLAGTVGRTTPTTKELVSVDLEANRAGAVKNLLPTIKEINDIGGGQMRAITMGGRGTTLRRQMEANPGLAVARQQQVLAIYQQTKDKGSDAFHRALHNAGLLDGVSKAATATVFLALKDDKTTQMVATNLEKMQEDYGRFQDADNQIKASADIVTSDKDFKTFINTASTQKVVTNASTVEKLAKAWGTTVQKLIESGVVEYQRAAYAKETYMPEEYRLSGTNIAKAYGFKSMEDAIKNGFNFGNAGSGGAQLATEINLAKDAALQRSYAGNEMGVRIVGDKVVDKALGDELLNASELTRFLPLNVKNWANVPGFDEEGRMTGGTKLAEGKTPKIGMRGTTVYMEIPYTYKDEDGQVRSNTVEVTAKPGQGALFETILRREALMNYQLKDKDKLAAQTFENTSVGLYNLMTSSNVTTQSAQAAHVSNSNRRAVLETRPSGEPGVDIQLVKEYVNEDVDPIFKAYIVTPQGRRDTGIKSTSVNGLKVQLTEQMYLKP